jgi:predicted nucleotidyltransferase component of viral defense system
MSSKAMSLKGRINNYAKKYKIAAQVVLQNYMFERFLLRLSKSEYQQKFVVKGGMLIAAIVGLDTRSTMDLDTTLRNLPLTEEKIMAAIQSICEIDMQDEVVFHILSIAPIRKDEQYGGFRVKLDAIYDTITTPLSIDVTTGDVITPSAVPYEFGSIFDETVRINIWGYNVETVLAEKAETILSRGIFNTRPRDYYDIYILGTTQDIDKTLFQAALAATADHRSSTSQISNPENIVARLSESDDLRQLWTKYQKKFSYAQGITFESILEVLSNLMS